MKTVMRKGEYYRCENPGCRAEIEVKKDSSEAESNPRCCCGAEMKRPYTKPAIRELDQNAAAAFAHLFEN